MCVCGALYMTAGDESVLYLIILYKSEIYFPNESPCANCPEESGAAWLCPSIGNHAAPDP